MRKDRPVLVVLGVVIPEGELEATDPIDKFTVAEVRDLNLRGKPLLVEHLAGTTCGYVFYDFVGSSDGKKYILAVVDGNSSLGLLTQKRIEFKALKDFSLTHLYVKIGNNDVKFPMEVSVCREGRRATCNILETIYYPASKMEDLYILAGQDNKKYIQASLMSASSDNTTITTLNNGGSTPTIVSVEAQQQPSSLPPLPPTDGSDKQGQQMFKNVEFLNEIQRIKDEFSAREASLLHREQNLIIKEQQEQDKLRAEITAMISASCETLGIAMGPSDINAVVAGLTPASEPALRTVSTAVSGLVSANNNKKKEIEDLRRKVQEVEEKHTAFQNKYQELAANNNSGAKFAPTDARFKSLPDVKLPLVGGSSPSSSNNTASIQSSPSYLINTPSHTNISPGFSIPPQSTSFQSQQQYQTYAPPAPVTGYSNSPASYYSHSAHLDNINQRLTSALVKASSSSAPITWNQTSYYPQMPSHQNGIPSQEFSIKQMVGFDIPYASVGPTTNYDAIMQNLRSNKK